MTVSGVFIWLGGGQTSEIDEQHERTSYIITGIGVTLTALTGGAITCSALALSGATPLLIGTVTLFTCLLTGLLGRAMAGAAPTARPELPAGTPAIGAVLVRLAVPVLVGLLVAEVAATVLFDGSVIRILDQRASAAVAAEPTVRAAHAELDSARTERGVLADTITTAQTDIDSALIVARCEYNPTPQCPRNKITGVPGRGPEAQTANAMLDDARARLAAATGRITTLDRRVTDGRRLIYETETAAFAEADRGIGARWSAMNEHTGSHIDALGLRLVNAAAFVLLALLPLILRRWRGETSLDRRRAARSVQHLSEDRLPVNKSSVDAKAHPGDDLLPAEPATPQRDSIDESQLQLDQRQRTKVVATIAGLEIGLVERSSSEKQDIRSRSDCRTAPLPGHKTNDPIATFPLSSAARALPTVPSRCAAEVGTAEPAAPDGLHLPLIGTVPFTDTAARTIGPLMPSLVTKAIACATHPLRVANQTLAGVEEVTVTLRRSHTASEGTHTLLVPVGGRVETSTGITRPESVPGIEPAQE